MHRRRQLKKRRDREEAERIALLRYNAACTLQRLFRMNDAWVKLMRVANNERVYYTRRKYDLIIISMSLCSIIIS